jgi:predicted RNA-binding protein with PIN domain
VFVDARNVLRSQWPNIPENELVSLCGAWAKANASPVVVVFDGNAPGGVLGERTLDDRVTLVGTGAETADDWLVRATVAHDGPYWLVTSDRALRAAAGGRAERVVGGGTFARDLQTG